jgi:hypothetical protein
MSFQMVIQHHSTSFNIIEVQHFVLFSLFSLLLNKLNKLAGRNYFQEAPQGPLSLSSVLGLGQASSLWNHSCR